ncbi:TetR/AcrR family transcriptional regulator [Desulfobacula sp.]|uniref:TetR/AcrR family transcriptional regulator n=1 Tax=Desulfobacula sp. TaxID=2593537 RepID=UPI0026263FFB|nr:TetR/AcrR family transcriptional regulator [Desulfobacula sp.]
MKEYKIKEHEHRRNRVYRIATKTLFQKGYDKTTIRDIAKATEMTTAGLYYYFKSKEDLLFQILNNHMDDVLAGLEKIPLDTSPSELIKRYIYYQVSGYCNDRYRFKLLLNDDDCLTGDWYKQIKKKQRKSLSYWRNALERYCQEKGLSTDHIAIDAHCLMGMCNWIYRWYDPKGEISPEALSLKIYETFLLGLGNKGKLSSME